MAKSFVFGSLFDPNRRRPNLTRTTTYNAPPEARTSSGVKSAVSSGISSLVQSYNQAYGEAKQANEQRYQQLLNLADQQRNERLGINTQQLDIAGQTTGQRAADIRSDAFNQESDIGQRLARIGMGNTTVGTSLRGGVQRDMQSNLNRLADTMQQTELGLLQRRADIGRGTKLGIMERRTDAYPDQSLLTNLVSSIGTGQGGDLIPSTLGALGGLYSGSSATGGAPLSSAERAKSNTQFAARTGFRRV